MILCIGTTPAAQRVMIFDRLRLGEVNRAVQTLDGTAGKSINVAKVVCALGGRAVAVGFLGGARGQEILLQLQGRLRLTTEFVAVSAPTRQCVTVIDRTTGEITELVEESRPVQPCEYDQLLEIVARHVRACHAMVLSGTVAQGGPRDFYLRCAQMAKENGVFCVADASGTALEELLPAGPALVKPNLPELEATVGVKLTDERGLRGAMRDLHDRGAQRVVITAGAAPALGFDGTQFCRITSPVIEALNPIGSGDAFTAAFVWQLTCGAKFEEACRWGAAAGAANALSWMAGEVELKEVERLLPAVKVEAI